MSGRTAEALLVIGIVTWLFGAVTDGKFSLVIGGVLMLLPVLFGVRGGSNE